MNHALLFSVFIVASCGLAYELIAGALASYLLGDSVTQFSTVIGTYLFAMGIGSWLSRYVERHLVARFIQVELMVGVLGGFSAAALFFLFVWSPAPFKLALYLAVAGVGVLVGLEIPLIMRIMKRDLAFKDLVSQVLTFDYLGALAVSILFPLLLVPHLGLVRSGLLFGLLNVIVALWAWWLFRAQLQPFGRLRAQGAAALLSLLVAFAAAGELTSLAEAQLYADEIVHAESTPYQRIVVTRWKNDVRLHLNNNLQFSSRDEYRYHEALVHPGLATLPNARRVLVLGGGDGLAVREILKYPQIESVTLVDLDPAMTRLFASAPPLRKLNQTRSCRPRSGSSTLTHCNGWRKTTRPSISSSSTFPIPRTSRSASSTAPPSTACSTSTSTARRWQSSSRPRRSMPASRSGASSRRSRASAWWRPPTTRWCRLSANGASSWPVAAPIGHRRPMPSTRVS
jgi:spermidine synthase